MIGALTCMKLKRESEVGKEDILYNDAVVLLCFEQNIFFGDLLSVNHYLRLVLSYHDALMGSKARELLYQKLMYSSYERSDIY